MEKKTSTYVVIIFIIGAIFLGFLLVNKGDGPVMGMMLADKAMENTKTYYDSTKNQSDGVYLVVSTSFNKYQEDYKIDIPRGIDLYSTVHFVECPQGSEFVGKWIKDGKVIKENSGILPSGPEGVISYMLDGELVVKGSYIFELYDGDSKIFDKSFAIE